MPRHRSLNLQKFVDSIPDTLIEEYFKQIFGSSFPLFFNSFDYDSIIKSLDALHDEEQKNNILEDFTHINDICENVMNFLVKAIKEYNIETTGEEKRQELAMNMFLHHKEAFNYAYDYYCLFNASSKMSHHNITADNFEITPEKINKFKNKVQKFYSDLAKGKECIIRHYDEEDQTVIVFIHGSYNQSKVIWQGKEVKTVFYRPAYEDILQFNKNTSILSIKASYQKDKLNYISTFTEEILGDKRQADRPDRDVTYTLEPLQNGTFSFVGNDVITSITLLEVKLAIRGITNPAIVIKSSNIIKTLEEDLSGVTLSSGDLVHAKFRFILEVNGKQRKITFEITPPNVTDLTKKKYADIVGDYLKENGVKLA
ncbi:MAG: hypothetical protein JW984_16630 [Deltaproteobacteria bacterium]|uniref:Uncharacterized protein n=1 Tax=Candidatus Zymogenus saltonus TaxID=2844893 RepID=A0A9D8KHM9_9DELT|nr:hypothetical protein [Candidatus Zymogenus saltonus]